MNGHPHVRNKPSCTGAGRGPGEGRSGRACGRVALSRTITRTLAHTVQSTTFAARAFLAFSVVAFAVAFVPTASAAVATLVIPTSTVLTEDQQGTMIVAADNVTLDCAAHTVSGPGNGYGDMGIVLDGRTGVVVKNCNVTGFVKGAQTRFMRRGCIRG